MARKTIRIFLVLGLLALAILAPFVSSGYAELRQASASGSYAEAAGHYQTAAQRLPWRSDLYELAGHAWYHAKDYVRADAAYQKAFSRQALSPAGWVAWGDVVYLNDDPERATSIWQEGLEQLNPSEQVYLRLANIAEERREFSAAMDYLRRYLSAYPEDAAAHYRLGILLTPFDPDHALPELIRAAELDPEFDPAVQSLRSTINLASLNSSPSQRSVILGRGLGVVEEWSLAYAAFEEATRTDERNAEAWAWLGEARQQMDWTGAEGDLDAALRLDPNSPTVRGLRGLYFQRLGNFRQALTEFRLAATLEPDNPTWQVSMGEGHAKLGDLIRALEAYQAATVLAPEDATYWRLLAIFCAQNNVYVAEVGVPAAQKVVLLSEADSASLDLLGWLLTLAARGAEAERMLVRALELDAQNASAHYHLGMLYLERQERDLAFDHFVRARDLGHREAEMVLSQYFP